MENLYLHRLQAQDMAVCVCARGPKYLHAQRNQFYALAFFSHKGGGRI